MYFKKKKKKNKGASRFVGGTSSSKKKKKDGFTEEEFEVFLSQIQINENKNIKVLGYVNRYD